MQGILLTVCLPAGQECYGSFERIQRGGQAGVCIHLLPVSTRGVDGRFQSTYFCDRYLVLLYYNPTKMQAKVDAKSKRDEIERLKKKLLECVNSLRLQSLCKEARGRSCQTCRQGSCELLRPLSACESRIRSAF